MLDQLHHKPPDYCHTLFSNCSFPLSTVCLGVSYSSSVSNFDFDCHPLQIKLTWLCCWTCWVLFNNNSVFIIWNIRLILLFPSGCVFSGVVTNSIFRNTSIAGIYTVSWYRGIAQSMLLLISMLSSLYSRFLNGPTFL